MREQVSHKILEIPFIDIKRLIDVGNRKKIAIKSWDYPTAAILRVEEKSIWAKYPKLQNIKPDDLVEILRDVRIDSLIN